MVLWGHGVPDEDEDDLPPCWKNEPSPTEPVSASRVSGCRQICPNTVGIPFTKKRFCLLAIAEYMNGVMMLAVIAGLGVGVYAVLEGYKERRALHLRETREALLERQERLSEGSGQKAASMELGNRKRSQTG